jgi:hypothetical protein
MKTDCTPHPLADITRKEIQAQKLGAPIRNAIVNRKT